MMPGHRFMFLVVGFAYGLVIGGMFGAMAARC
jgi:hypothetical protein